MDTLAQALLAYKSIAVAAWLALLFALERIMPAVERPADRVALAAGHDGALARAGWTRVARNAGLFLVNAALSPLIVVPVSAWATTHALGWRPAWLEGWLGLAVDLVLLDFWIYWWHRSLHSVPLLWRFHVIHHLDRFLDAISGTRFHFGEVLLSACVRAVVIILAGIPLTSVLVFETLVLAAAMFQHSNWRLPPAFEQALSRIIVTPSLHWMHHHAVRRDTDSTYGTIFSFWDRMFGSVAAGTRTPDMVLGVDAGAAPLDDERLLDLLTRPLRRG